MDSSILPTEWTTSAGKKVPIEAMNDFHLTNSIKLLRRRARRFQAEDYVKMKSLLGNETESGPLRLEDIVEELLHLDPIEYIEQFNINYIALLKEYNCRKLDHSVIII